MSGTSIDSVDAVLAHISHHGHELQATLEHPIPPGLRQAIADISQPGNNEIERMGVLDRQLGELFADACTALLDHAGVPASDVFVIGSHGQTIRHRPPSGGNAIAYTLQIGDPSTIAERTGITTVADFRRRDVAAGGEGAPLAPAFHAAAFARAGVNRAVVNIGGIANVSLLVGETLLTGFDTGPGNTLLDQWVHHHRGERYDRDGAWAAEGAVDPQLLARMQQHPFLAQQGARSTGKETFHLNWLTRRLHGTMHRRQYSRKRRARGRDLRLRGRRLQHRPDAPPLPTTGASAAHHHRGTGPGTGMGGGCCLCLAGMANAEQPERQRR